MRSGTFGYVLALILAAAGPSAAQAPPPEPAHAPAPAPAPEGTAAAPKQKPPPRIMVLTFGAADRGEMAPIVQSAAEEVLLDLRFPLVDESQAIASYQIEDLERFLILTIELRRLAELKARFGADLVCTVQYTRRFQYERDMDGAKSQFYKNDARVRMIAADTGEVVASGGGESPISARQSVLEDLVREHVRKGAERFLERTSYEAVGPSTYQVVAVGFDEATVARLGTALRGKAGVAEVAQREYGGKAAGAGNGIIEVKFQGTVDELKALLQSVGEPAVEVRAASANRIEVVPKRA